MTKRLHKCLVAAGVENLQIYNAEIHETGTGTVYSDYIAFNLIGAVPVADLKNSNYTGANAPIIDGGFTSLSIDEDKAKAGGLLMFRLAESVITIVIHGKVKKAVESAGINTLNFLSPAHWGT